MLKDSQDAIGHEIYDCLNKKGGYEIVERDDGFFGVSLGPKSYLSNYDQWSEHQQQAIEYVRGRVLDIGCGAGRHSLYLQEQGFNVTGIDISPLAIQVCKSRGLKKAQVLSITEIGPKLGVFDTILMLGINFGLFGSHSRAKWLLRRLHKITSPQARIIAETRDPYGTDLPEHLGYHEFNRKRGRMPGQLRIRVRYKKYVSPWFDYLLASKEEIEKILVDTVWMTEEFIDGGAGVYIAVIQKRN